LAGFARSTRREIVELDREHMNDIARRHGLTEHEAMILHHLDRATHMYKELPDHYDKDLSDWMAHKEALGRLLMVRVVKRDHPEGWLAEAEEEYRMLAEDE
jgi:hypothetical protein